MPLDAMRMWLRALFRRDRVESDMEKEMRIHLDLETDANIRRGMSPIEARRQAAIAFGGVDRHKESERDERGTRLIEETIGDARLALRRLKGSPAFALGVIATLALGIGANALMARSIDRLLLRGPAHVRDEASLKRVMYHAAARNEYGDAGSYPLFTDLRDGVPAFSDVAAQYAIRSSLGVGAEAQNVNVIGVTGAYFSMLGATPLRGRFVTPADDSIGTPHRVAVISEALWRRRFESNPEIIGRPIRLAFGTYTVIGIAPLGFEGVNTPGADVWLPLSAAAPDEGWISPDWDLNRKSYWIRIMARLAPGESIAEAEAQANTVMKRGYAQIQREAPRLALSSVIAGRALNRPREVRVSFWLSGVSLLVLLIACANVANLLLTRTMLQGREVALRTALGASAWRIQRQFLVETLLLTFGAGVVAFALVLAGGRVLRSAILAPADGGLVDMRILLIGAGITVLAALTVSLAPALQLRGASLVSALQRRGGATGRRHPAQIALLGVQALLAVVMLIGAGLFGRSLHRVQSLDLGVDVDRTIVAGVDLQRLGLPLSDNNALFDEFVRRVRQLPSIEDATVATVNPYMSGSGASPWIPGTTRAATWAGKGEVAYRVSVGPRFFMVTGATSLTGRDFSESDREGSAPVVIINRPLEKRLFGSVSALDKCIMVAEHTCARVIGVLGGVFKFNALDREKMTVFYPLGQDPSAEPRSGAVLARARGDVGTAMLDVRAAMQSVRPDLPAARVQVTREFTDPQFLPWRMGATMFLLFGAVALLLAGAGLYSVAMYAVTQRTREFAVRIALGSTPQHLTRAAVRGELLSILAGTVVGSLVALSISKWSGPLLYQTSPRDPLVIAAAGTAIAIVAALAVFSPVRRALRLDPAALLRLEQ